MLKKQILVGTILLAFLVGCSSGNTTTTSSNNTIDNPNPDPVKETVVLVDDTKETDVVEKLEDLKEEIVEEVTSSQRGFDYNGLHFEKIIIEDMEFTLGQDTLEDIYYQALEKGHNTSSCEKLPRFSDNKPVVSESMVGPLSFEIGKENKESSGDPSIWFSFTNPYWEDGIKGYTWNENKLSEVGISGTFTDDYYLGASVKHKERFYFKELEWDLGNGLNSDCNSDDFYRLLGEPWEETEKSSEDTDLKEDKVHAEWRVDKKHERYGNIEIDYLKDSKLLSKIKIGVYP